MELGVDRFLFSFIEERAATYNPVPDLLEEIELAERVGLDVFGIGEHHTREFSDSSPPVLLAAAAARTSRIRLSSAITILGAADPVRVFEEFATLDLVSGGRAEIIAGRGAYAEAFTLFGLDLDNYDEFYREKLELLLELRTGKPVRWSGRHRPALNGQVVYPRPLQAELPVWVGATGSPESFARAGHLGLPLALGTIGGHIGRLRPLVEIYRRAGADAGHKPDRLRVALHALGFVGATTEQAKAEFFPGYEKIFGEIGKRAGWPTLTRDRFDQITGPGETVFVGSVDQVADRLRTVSEILGGLSRICLQMSVGPLGRTERHGTIEGLAAVRHRLGGTASRR